LDARESSAVRFGVPALRSLGLPVCLVVGAFFVSPPAAAQQFLACSHATGGALSAGSIHTRTANDRWLQDGREILHAFAGDDLFAYFGFRPRIHITSQASPNAFAVKPDSIVVSTALLDLIDSTSEFAFVIAHELGHLVLDRRESIQTLAPLDTAVTVAVAQEVAADSYALELLRSAGFDPTAGRALLSKIGGLTGQSGVPVASVFPSIPARLSAMANRLSEPRTPG